MSDKMTIRQIASAAGCNHKTVRKAVDELFPGRAQNGVRIEFTRSEAFQIMEKLPKRAMVSEPSQKREGDLAENGKVDIQALVRETVAATIRELVPALVQAIQGVAPKAPAALPPPPELEPRDALRKIVGEYATAHERDFRGAWSNLYREFELRTHRNVRQCAKNRGLDTLDYCEDEGLLGEMLALAYHLYAKSEAA